VTNVGPFARPSHERRILHAFACALALSLAPAASAGDWKLERFGIKNKKADFEAKLTGYVQFDQRGFDWQVEDPTFRNDDRDIRRARTGIEVAWKKLALDYDLDWTGSARRWADDDAATGENGETKNAYAQYNFSKKFSLRAGNTKVPVSYEFLTSAGKTDLVERALLDLALAPDRDWGVMALGELKKLSYMAGVFKGDGRVNFNRAKTTVAARLVTSPWKPLDVAASFSLGEVDAAPDHPGTDPNPKGVRGESPSGWRFYDRKFVDGRRLRWGLDSQYTRGGFQLKGELLQMREERKRQGSTFQDLPSEVGTGWSATASYILTGEKKQRTLKPNRPLLKGGPGLIELAVKYEGLRFDDAEGNSGFEGAGNRARNLRPAQDRVLWGGVSWFPGSWVRLTANGYMERYLDPLLAPEPPGARFVSGRPKERGNYFTFVARIQFIIP